MMLQLTADWQNLMSDSIYRGECMDVLCQGDLSSGCALRLMVGCISCRDMQDTVQYVVRPTGQIPYMSAFGIVIRLVFAEHEQCRWRARLAVHG